MSCRFESLFGVLLVVGILATLTHAQDRPVVVDDDITTGIFGSMMKLMGPFTDILLQFLNSLLIHTRGEQLPCTIFDLANFKFACTPVPGA